MTAAHTGTFYGVGVGPGDPELLTLKAVRVLRNCACIYVPSSRLSTQNYVAEVVKSHASPTCESVPVTFSLAGNSKQRQHHWHTSAQQICARLQAGQDVAFVTLGDPLLYSTYIYLLRALRDISPTTKVETVPGISAFSAAAALTNSTLGEGLHPLTLIPAATDLEQIRTLLAAGGGVVLMKIGPLLPQIITLLEQADALSRSVFVARAGLPEQHIETDLLRLRHAPPQTGNLAVIIVQARRK